MSRRTRLIALLMCAGMLLSLCLSSVCVAHAMGHVCTGEDCPVCAFIARIERARRDLGLLLAVLFSACLALAVCHFPVAGAGEALPAGGVLVGRKIRLND